MRLDDDSHVRGMTCNRDRHAAAQIRVQLALDSIQEAQRLIRQAAQALSRVDGMIPESRRAGSIADHLAQTWLTVSAGANRLRRKRS